MKFKDLNVGDRFKFCFDGDRDWEYEKFSETQIKCVDSPCTSRHVIGTLQPWGEQDEEVVVFAKKLVCLHCFSFVDHKDFNELLEKTVIFKDVDAALAYKKSVIDQYDTFQLTWSEFYG